MTMLPPFKHSTPLLALTILLFITIFSANAFAANYPLEIINIKPAGSGSPAIPSTNRIFHAYPGTEYNIRPAVIGGLYPFKYQLTNAPTGMTINESTGEIKWTPSSAQTTGTITVSVTDSENTTVKANWAITVDTSDFIFVDDSNSGTGDGSFSNPYSSISNMLNNTTAADVDKIVYFRGGNYNWITYNPSSTIDMKLENKPWMWIGYGNEVVNMNANDIYMRSWGRPLYLDNLHIYNMTNYGAQFWGGENYSTVRRCTFNDITSDTSTNINQGILQSTKASPAGSYLVVQNNEFSKFTSAQAIGSLYHGTKVLIEDNYIHDGGYSGMTSFTTAIGLKEAMTYVTIRHNIISYPPGTGTAVELYGGISMETNNVDISFNNISHGSTDGNAISFQFIFNMNAYRNTFIGNVKFNSIDVTSCTKNGGPFKLYNNVVINPNAGWIFNAGDASLCLSDTNNLKGTTANNIVDDSGNLTTSYSSYFGTVGWQTNGATEIPVTAVLKATTGLRVAN